MSRNSCPTRALILGAMLIGIICIGLITSALQEPNSPDQSQAEAAQQMTHTAAMSSSFKFNGANSDSDNHKGRIRIWRRAAGPEPSARRVRSTLEDYTYDDWISNKVDDWLFGNGAGAGTVAEDSGNDHDIDIPVVITTPSTTTTTTTRKNWYPDLPISWGRMGTTRSRSSSLSSR